MTRKQREVERKRRQFFEAVCDEAPDEVPIRISLQLSVAAMGLISAPILATVGFMLHTRRRRAAPPA